MLKLKVKLYNSYGNSNGRTFMMFVVADTLFIVAPFVCEGSVFCPCFVIQYFVPV